MARAGCCTQLATRAHPGDYSRLLELYFYKVGLLLARAIRDNAVVVHDCARHVHHLPRYRAFP